MTKDGRKDRESNSESQKPDSKNDKFVNPFIVSFQYAQAQKSFRHYYLQANSSQQQVCKQLLQSAQQQEQPTASLRDLRDALKQLGIEGVNMVKIIVGLRMQLASVEQLEAHRRIARQLLQILDELEN
jgi:hypothetical protein